MQKTLFSNAGRSGLPISIVYAVRKPCLTSSPLRGKQPDRFTKKDNAYRPGKKIAEMGKKRLRVSIFNTLINRVVLSFLRKQESVCPEKHIAHFRNPSYNLPIP
jgi:hypothetical protein